MGNSRITFRMIFAKMYEETQPHVQFCKGAGGIMNQTVPGYIISEAVRDRMYMVLAMFVKINNDPHYLDECRDRIDIMLHDVLRPARKVFLYEWERDSMERDFEETMEQCLRAHSEFGPSEGQEPVFIAYGKMFEDVWLGRPYDEKRFTELYDWLMNFELAA